MYKLLLVFAVGTLACSACNSPSGTTEKTTDSTVIPPAPSNSDATNPSVADTAYHQKKDSMAVKDSTGKQK